MQAPTHLATGILIQKGLSKAQPPSLRYPLIAVLALLSHGILDGLARFTYHPPTPLVQDWFWISYHSIVALLTVYIFFKFWKEYKLGLIFSILPDVDWIVLHSSDLLSVQVPFWKEPILHKLLFSFLDLLRPLKFLDTLPNWNLERKGIILELVLLAVLITSIYAIERGRKLALRRNKGETDEI
jgi:hypothetical protein